MAEAASDFRHMINDVEYITNPVKKGFLKVIHNVNKTHFKDAFTHWFRFGGFPEPFLKGSDRFSIRWRKNYKSLSTTQDLRDLTRIHDIKGIEQLILILPERVAAPLSINSLREDLQVNHRTISNWLEAYKKIYLVFSLMPWVQSITKAIKKEQKYYFFDWTMVGNPGASFENACAVSLLRLVNRWNELGLGDFELRYIRNIQRYEVDFVLLKNNNPVALFEAKISETQIPTSSIYFANLLSIPYYQIVADDIEIREYPKKRFILPAWRLLPLLG